MSRHDSLIELRDALAKATGPDRMLDARLFVALSPSPFSIYEDCIMAQQGGFSARVEFDDVPKYTRSIDAAVTLAPDDQWGVNWDIESVFDPDAPDRVSVITYVWVGHPTNEKSFVRSGPCRTYAEAAKQIARLICAARVGHEIDRRERM